MIEETFPPFSRTHAHTLTVLSLICRLYSEEGKFSGALEVLAHI